MQLKIVFVCLIIILSKVLTYELAKDVIFKPKITFDDADLRLRLTKEQYEVTQEGETEDPYMNIYEGFNQTGTYNCIVCDELLFNSEQKFGNYGWPAFSAGSENTIILKEISIFLSGIPGNYMARTQVRCRNCGSFVGHHFNDEKSSTGERYFVNSYALSFNALK